MKTFDYIAAIKARHGVTSDYAVAKLLEISTQNLSGWRAGRILPGTLVCYKMAELLDMKPAVVLADIELERAERSHRDGDAKAWRGWLQKLSGATLAGLVAMSFVSAPSPAEAHSETSYGSVYIM